MYSVNVYRVALYLLSIYYIIYLSMEKNRKKIKFSDAENSTRNPRKKNKLRTVICSRSKEQQFTTCTSH